MGVETATWITDLQPANPGSSDLRSQGDDHLRLLKQVLQDNFPTASKAWYNPTTSAKSADFTVLAANMNTTFLVDTSGGIVNMTLPTLAAGDAGWECFLIKTTLGTVPVLVKPASGSVSSGNFSVTAARRAIPNIRIQCLWTGTAWIISRACNVPVGSTMKLHIATLPYGFEWPNGQTLASASANYLEFYTANGSSGVTLDKRGRVDITLDNLGGSAAGRLAGGIITGTAIGNTGGTDTVTLALAGVPTGIISSGVNSISVSFGQSVLYNGGSIITLGNGGAPSGVSWVSIPSVGGLTSTGNNTIGVTSTNTGGGSHSNLQPSIMVAEVLVVE